MLDSLTPEQFRELAAFRQLEPDPLTRLWVIVKRGLLMIAAAQGIQVEPEQIDPWHEEVEVTNSDEAVKLMPRQG